MTLSPPAPSHRPGPSKDDGTAFGRVLVVDDDVAVGEFVARVLGRAGHDVDTAGGVDAALTRLFESEYDVLLVDIDMPGRNGLELLDEVRAGGFPVVSVLLTGTTDIGTAVSGMKRGAFDYLAKPADPDALRWTVARAVGVARARQRERVLERVVADWTATFDACPDLLFVLDAGGRVVRANSAVARAVGADAPLLVGESVDDLFPGGLGAVLALAGEGGAEWAALAEPRKVFDPVLGRHFLVSVNPIDGPGEDRPNVVFVARDISDSVHGEQVRVRLYRRLLSAQEDERGRLARELHDGVGQALVSLAVGLTSMADAPIDDDLRDRVRRLNGVAAETLEEIRLLAQGLRPTVLDDIGLTAALKRLAESYTRTHGTVAELLLPESRPGRLPREVESAVYRITQEALTNVAKHARARTVDVVMEVTDRGVRLMVSDDGVGFVGEVSPRTQSGLGLTGMRERAAMLGGTLRTESVPGKGTTIDVVIPLAEEIP